MSSLAALLDSLARLRILVLGDSILDRYTFGNAERVSPEAPVIVLRVDGKEVRLGGAASVAMLLRALGADVILAGVVGEDSEGRTLRSLLRDEKIDSHLVLIDPSRPTTTKERIMGRAANRHAHQIVRVDHEDRSPINAALEEGLIGGIIRQLAPSREAQPSVEAASCRFRPSSSTLDPPSSPKNPGAGTDSKRIGPPGSPDVVTAILIADYAKGVCTPALLRRVIDLARGCHIPVIVDPARVADYTRYAGATLVKPNRFEAELATGRKILTPDDALAAARHLCDTFNLESVLITLDHEGMALVEAASCRFRPSSSPAVEPPSCRSPGVESSRSDCARTPKDPGAGTDSKRIGPPGSPNVVTASPASSLDPPSSLSLHLPITPREVYDITGAGDMVLATLGLCLASGVPLPQAAQLANIAAGLEVERLGVAPITRAELRRALVEAASCRSRPSSSPALDPSSCRLPAADGSPADCASTPKNPGAYTPGSPNVVTASRSSILDPLSSSASKLTTLAALLPIRAAYQDSGQRVTFTNGCFDLIHVGHVTMLEQAAALGDVLIVAINSDASVRALKGPDRPVIPEQDRAQMLASLACVDHVLIFDDTTPQPHPANQTDVPRSRAREEAVSRTPLPDGRGSEEEHFADGRDLHALLEAIRPDILAKGGTTPKIIGRELVESYGGRVVRLGTTPGISTTALVNNFPSASSREAQPSVEAASCRFPLQPSATSQLASASEIPFSATSELRPQPSLHPPAG